VNKKINEQHIAPCSLEQMYFNKNDCTSSHQNHTGDMQTQKYLLNSRGFRLFIWLTTCLTSIHDALLARHAYRTHGSVLLSSLPAGVQWFP